jgi:hypothetical protein
MTNAGMLTTVEVPKLPATFPSSNVRLALYDGSQWFEITYRSGASHVPTGSLPQSSSPSEERTKMIVSFIMPQPIGLNPARSNWWKIASDLGLDKRFALTLQDMTNAQRTTIFVYLRTNGHAPAPNYPFLSELIANGTGLGSSTQANGFLDVRRVSMGPFAVAEESSVDTSTLAMPASGSDPNVFANVSITHSSYFVCCQYTAAYFYPQIPLNRLYAHLILWGQTSDDPNVDQLTVQISGVQVLTASVHNGFYYDLGVLDKLSDQPDLINSVYIAITTTTGRWAISAQFDIEYSASQFIVSGGNVFAAGYTFRNTGQSVKSFNAFIPNGISAATMYFQLTDSGDTTSRTFDVSVAGVEITPSGGLQRSASFNWQSGDLTGLVAYSDHVRVDVLLNTVGTGYYWTLWAYVNTNARYEVWPDSYSRWGSTLHPIEQAGMNLYDTTLTLESHFLSAPGIEIKTIEHSSTQYVDVGVTEHIPDWVQNDYKQHSAFVYGLLVSNEIHVWTSHQGSNLPQSDYPVVNGYQSPNSNSQAADVGGVGSDILAIVAAVTSPLPGGQVATVPAAIGSVLIKYLLLSQGSTFSFGQETNGVYLKDYTRPYNDLSDILQFGYRLPAPGVYTVNVSVNAAIYLYYFDGFQATYGTLSSQTYYLSTYYNY